MSDNKITFAHISDIHFIKGLSGESNFDIDEKVRQAILDDAEKNFRKRFSQINGILVTGDIAFAGKIEEYETAINWLSDFCKALNCNEGHVWCVPGNHDIDQNVHNEFSAIPALHEQLRRAQSNDQGKLNNKMREHLENENTGPIIFSPLKIYNEKIGQRFDCTTTPKKPWWEDEIELNDSSKLRIRGLNSVIVSGRNDENDKLLLGPAQTELGRYDGVEYLTLCHHPVDWLLDHENTMESLLAYSRIQLFGHKHIQKVTEMDNTLWLSAGAVHPVRSEKKWLPQYNYISIWIDGTGTERYFCVDVYSREWSQSERKFTRRATSENADFKNYRLKLPEWKPSMVADEEHKTASRNGQGPESVNCRNDVTWNRKELLYLFLGLPHYKRKSIMKKHNLIEDGDNLKSEAEIFAKCFERAREKGVLEAVWQTIIHEKGQP